MKVDVREHPSLGAWQWRHTPAAFFSFLQASLPFCFHYLETGSKEKELCCIIIIIILVIFFIFYKCGGVPELTMVACSPQ